MTIETNQQSDALIPPANTPSEINIHLGYIRRDIINLQSQTSSDMRDLKDQITELGDHYVTAQQFAPIADQVKKHVDEIEELKTWKDNSNGKLVGLGFGISIATSAITFMLTYFIKH